MSINLIYEEDKTQVNITQGYNSYLKDVVDVINSSSLDITLNSNSFCKYTILFHSLPKPSYIPYTPEYIVRVLHSGEKEIPKEDLNWFPKEKFIYFTQYKDQQEFLESNGFTSFFFPMRINTQNLPETTTKNGKWIYFGNVYENKEDTLEILRNSISFDILSYSQLNGEGDILTHTECLELVSQYSYGIGVGRCALEMMGMGIPVLLAGKNIGGTLVTEEDLNFHSNYNCNGDGSNSITLEEDIKKILNNSSTILKDNLQLDLNNWVSVLT